MIKDKYLTINQSAEVLNVTRQTIYRWIKSGWIKPERVGRLALIHKSNLEAICLHKIQQYKKTIKYYREKIRELN